MDPRGLSAYLRRPSSAPPPLFLRGVVRKWAVLEAVLCRRVGLLLTGDAGSHEPLSAVDLESVGASPMDAAVGYRRNRRPLGSKFGFAAGCVLASGEALVADLTSAGGPPCSVAEAIASLHEQAFSSYPAWAQMVGATGVRPGGSENSSLGEEPPPVAEPAAGCCCARRRPPPPAPLPALSSLSLPSPSAQLDDLALLYMVRAESANLRFAPECMLWLWHQMRHGTLQPPRSEVEAAVAAAAGGAPSFVMQRCVSPLYEVLRKAAADGGTASGRINYDDLNEMFWRPACLDVAWWDEVAGGGAPSAAARAGPPAAGPSILRAPSAAPRAGPPAAGPSSLRPQKSYYERSSYLTLLLAFWRIALLQLVMAYALCAVAQDIVDGGGSSLADLPRLRPRSALVAASGAMAVSACGPLGALLLAGARGTPPRLCPPSAPACRALGRALCTCAPLARALWALAWAGGFLLLLLSEPLLGLRLFGGPAWWGACAARGAVALLSETRLASGAGACGARLRRALLALERPSATPGGCRLLGRAQLALPLRSVAASACFWALVLGAKALLDVNILIQMLRLVRTLELAGSAPELPPLAPAWELRIGGGPAGAHGLLLLGGWLSTAVLLATNSALIYTLAGAALGVALLAREGLGAIGSARAGAAAFGDGGGGGGGRRLPLAQQWARVSGGGAAREGLFARAWDAAVCALRAEDLLSDAETARLLHGCGGAQTGGPQLPLFLQAGRLAGLLSRPRSLAAAAARVRDDGAFLAAVLPSAAGVRAAVEAREGILAALEAVARAHSAVGPGDARLAATLRALCAPRPGQSLRACAGELLGEAGGAAAGLLADALALLREFERPGACVGVAGSPLAAAALALIARLAALRGAAAGGGGEAPTSGEAVGPSTASARGLLALLSLPSAGGAVRLCGSLRGGTDAMAARYEPPLAEQERLESAHEASRRAFFLLASAPGCGGLACAEAERRLLFFMSSLYARALPRAAGGVLAMPRLAVVTPLYAEAVLLSAGELAPLSGFLRAKHPAEWAHLCERLGLPPGAGAEEVARARADAGGAPASGEWELRSWASARCQTLARTVAGVMHYADAVRLLAWGEIEAEYAALAAAAGGGGGGGGAAEAAALEADAAAAAAWFTSRRFSYLIAAQRYAAHEPADLAHRSQLSALLALHPLLRVVHWQSAGSGARRRHEVLCRDAQGVRAQFQVPGLPIQDAIGEGKPENVNATCVFQHGAFVQVRACRRRR